MSARTADPSIILASGVLLRGTPDGTIDAGTGPHTSPSKTPPDGPWP